MSFDRQSDPLGLIRSRTTSQMQFPRASRWRSLQVLYSVDLNKGAPRNDDIDSPIFLAAMLVESNGAV